MYAECICEASLKLLVTLDSIWLEGVSRKCPSILNVPKYNHRSLLSISRDEWQWTWCDVYIRWAIRYTDYPQYIIHEFSPLFIVCALLICLLVLIVRWLCSQVNIKYHASSVFELCLSRLKMVMESSTKGVREISKAADYGNSGERDQAAET